MTATKTISAVTLTHATIGEQKTEWAALIRAAEQDRDARTIRAVGDISRGNGEVELASVYRDILRGAVPLIDSQRQAAYQDYCTSSATTRGSDPAHAIGHGTWVSGPDGSKQETWQAWDRLAKQVAAVCRE